VVITAAAVSMAAAIMAVAVFMAAVAITDKLFQTSLSGSFLPSGQAGRGSSR
jgi:hypothetical protein